MITATWLGMGNFQSSPRPMTMRMILLRFYYTVPRPARLRQVGMNFRYYRLIYWRWCPCCPLQNLHNNNLFLG